MATKLRPRRIKERDNNSRFEELFDLKEVSVQRALEVGLYVEDSDGTYARRVLCWERTCGRIQEDGKMCHAKGTETTMARDCVDNKCVRHLTCEAHVNNAVWDKDGKLTEEVRVSRVNPAVYWELSTDEGITWTAGEELDDDEYDCMAEYSPEVQLFMCTPLEYKRMGLGEFARPNEAEWGGGVNEMLAIWEQARDEARARFERAAATPEHQQELNALREVGPEVVKTLRMVSELEDAEDDTGARQVYGQCMRTLKSGTPELHRDITACEVATRHRDVKDKAAEVAQVVEAALEDAVHNKEMVDVLTSLHKKGSRKTVGGGSNGAGLLAVRSRLHEMQEGSDAEMRADTEEGTEAQQVPDCNTNTQQDAIEDSARLERENKRLYQQLMAVSDEAGQVEMRMEDEKRRRVELEATLAQMTQRKVVPTATTVQTPEASASMEVRTTADYGGEEGESMQKDMARPAALPRGTSRLQGISAPDPETRALLVRLTTQVASLQLQMKRNGQVQDAANVGKQLRKKLQFAAAAGGSGGGGDGDDSDSDSDSGDNGGRGGNGNGGNGNGGGRPGGYGQGRDVGRQRNELQVGHTLTVQDVIRMGNEFVGNEKGVSIWELMNTKLYETKEDLQMLALVHKVADTFEGNLKRTKKIWKKEGACKDKESWRELYSTGTVVYEAARARLKDGGEDKFAWVTGGTTNAIVAGRTSQAENRLTQQYFQLTMMDKFVEGEIAAGRERMVLDYMFMHFQKLAAAEKAMHFSHNVALWRVFVINKEFVDKGCVLSTEMWKSGLSKPAAVTGGSGTGTTPDDRVSKQSIRDIIRHELGNAKVGKGGNEGHGTKGDKNGGGKKATGWAPTGGGDRGHIKFGFAPPIMPYRTSDTNKDGQPYLNHRGEPYNGSVCDKCEMAGRAYHQHPLRCSVCNPGWKDKGGAPEENGVTTWWIRGDGEASIGDQGVAGK